MPYTVKRGSREVGSFSREELRQAINDAKLLVTDLAWRQEDERWVHLAELLATPEPGPPTPILPNEASARAFVGTKYDSYYRGKWSRMDNRSTSAWNWAAFFFGPFWLAYRKMYSYVWTYLGCFAAADIVILALRLDKYIGSGVSMGLAVQIGRLGNCWYKDHVTKRIAAIGREDAQRLAKVGGTSIRAALGFVLLSLVVSAVTYAILG